MPNRVMFRYRLAASIRRGEAGTPARGILHEPQPGSYRFQVIAANEDGVWNEAGASIEFEIPPSFTQTRAFIGLIATSIAAAWVQAGFTALWRQRQMARALHAQFEGQLAERARVARELTTRCSGT